jgi:PEP-CTERM motif
MHVVRLGSLLSGLISCAIVLVPTLANASTITINQTVDISSCHNNLNSCNVQTSLGGNQSIAVGDVVNATIDFLGTQQLSMFDDGPTASTENFMGWLALGPGGTAGSFTVVNASMTLTDLSGSLLSPLTRATETGGTAHLGAQFVGDRITTGSSISFSGYQFSFTVNALPANPNIYSRVWTVFSADRFQVETTSQLSEVPEPATLSLLGLGLAVAAVRHRMKRR